MLRTSEFLRRRSIIAAIGRPSTLVVGAVLIALLVIELILTARFWLQLTGFGSELRHQVLALSKPLIAPFSGIHPSLADRTAGTFEFGTLLAAEAYLALAATLTFGILLGRNRMAKRPRPPAAHMPALNANMRKPARLCNTFFLPLEAAAAGDTLSKLGLERFDLRFVTIPAEGGSVVAVFAPVGAEAPGVPVLSRLRLSRQEHVASRLLASIGATHAMPASTTSAVTPH